jgi:hypothetical protein
MCKLLSLSFRVQFPRAVTSPVSGEIFVEPKTQMIFQLRQERHPLNAAPDGAVEFDGRNSPKLSRSDAGN